MELIKGGREYQGYRAGYQQLIVLDDGVKLVMISRPGYNGDPNQYHKDLIAFCDTGGNLQRPPAREWISWGSLGSKRRRTKRVIKCFD